MLNKILFSLVLLFFFQSCGQTESAIKETFTKIKNHETWEDVLNNIDQSSHDYLTQIANLAITNDETAISNFCNNQKFPLSARYLIQAMAMMNEGENENKFDKKDVLVIAALSNMGLIGIETKSKYSFHESEVSSNNVVSAVANYRVQSSPKISVQSRFQFSEEDGQWKLYLPSTFSYGEKYYLSLIHI